MTAPCPGPCQMMDGCLCDTYCEHDEMMGFCEKCEPPCSVCQTRYGRCSCCESCGSDSMVECQCDAKDKPVVSFIKAKVSLSVAAYIEFVSEDLGMIWRP